MAESSVLSIVIPVFNGAMQIVELLRTLKADTCYVADEVEIVIVDDCSDIALTIDNGLASALGITLIRHGKNQGRAQARNTGAAHARGRFLLFLDVDCIPEAGFLNSALKYVRSNESVVFGHIRFVSEPFYETFENEVQKERSAGMDHWHLNMTTACMLVRRDIFESIGGYSSLYTKYGMEDRDLLIRIHTKYSGLGANYSYGMAVTHKGELSLGHYVNKFVECGQYSIPVFRTQQPQAYRQMKYSAFDYVSNRWIRWIPKPAMKLIAGALFSALMTCYQSLNTYPSKALCLKLLKGVALLKGTIKATS